MNNIQELKQIKTLLEVAVLSNADAKITSKQAKAIVEQAEEMERLKAALNAVANWDKATKEEVDNCVEVLKALTPPEGK
jgi:DNA-binding GntR family transcriptional regulator